VTNKYYLPCRYNHQLIIFRGYGRLSGPPGNDTPALWTNEFGEPMGESDCEDLGTAWNQAAALARLRQLGV
jgi:hypothetical protein